MKKMLIIIIFIFLSAGCVCAEDNMHDEIYELNDIQHHIISETTLNLDNSSNTEKYYCKDDLTNQEYFIYKNGSVCKVDNSSFTPYEYWLFTNKYDAYLEPKDYKIFDNVLSKEQIDFYLENGYFSYARAYIKAHGENFTYDEVFNAKSVSGDSDAWGWRFYNNGTVECSLAFIGEDFQNLTYSKSYVTSIFGTAGWNNEPLSKFVVVVDNITMAYEDEGYIENAYRFPNGEFSSNMLDRLIFQDRPSNNQINITNNTTKMDNQTEIINNIVNTTKIDNLTIITNNSSSNMVQSIQNQIICIENTANPLIALLMTCILIPIGFIKNKK